MMTYRIARIANYYPGLITEFFSKQPSFHQASAESIRSGLAEFSCDITYSYARAWNKWGVDTLVIMTNVQPWFEALRKENTSFRHSSEHELVIHQLKQFKPDVIWIDDLSFFSEEWKQQVTSSIPSIKLWVTHLCAPYERMLHKLKLFDLVFTCAPHLENVFKSCGLNAFSVYHGFDESILQKITVSTWSKKIPVLFTGSLYTGSSFHQKRIQFIEKLIGSGINLHLFANTESRLKFYARKGFDLWKKGIIKETLAMKYYSRSLLSRISPPVFGLNMFKLLAESSICINMHIDAVSNSASNMRLFEATGMGVCLVTDHKDNLQELFEPGKEVITYRSAEECIDKIKWLQKHPDEMEKIAKAGQQRTLREHTIEKRAVRLHEIIIRHLK